MRLWLKVGLKPPGKWIDRSPPPNLGVVFCLTQIWPSRTCREMIPASHRWNNLVNPLVASATKGALGVTKALLRNMQGCDTASVVMPIVEVHDG